MPPVAALWILACPASLAEREDPSLLAQQSDELYKEGKYKEAIPIAEKLLAIRKKELGPEHPDTAQSLNNLALLYQAMGEYAKAEPLLQEALRVRQKVLGPEHPDTAQSLNNLALVYWATGEYAKAEPLYQEALRILQKVLGKNILTRLPALRILQC
jgi:tetratricopeptide (TPR) repeat protein